MKKMRKLSVLLAITGSLGLMLMVLSLIHEPQRSVLALNGLNAAPVIVVDPPVIDGIQPTNALVTHTLAIYNVGDADLDWAVYEGAVSLWEQTDNASVANGVPSQNFPDIPGDEYGYAADDFVIPGGQFWQIDRVFVPGIYTAGDGPAPDFDVRVYSDGGGMPDMVVVSDTAVIPISDNNGNVTLEVEPPLVLDAGTYWLSVNANMDFGMQDQWFWRTRTVQTDSPYHWTETGVFSTTTACIGMWQPGAAVCGVGGGVDPDLLFGLYGDYASAPCDPLNTLPWVAVAPISGTVAMSSTLSTTVTFDSFGYVPGVYTGTLCIASNDPVQPLLPVPLTMTVMAPAFAVQVGPDASSFGLPGATVNYTLWVTNVGNTADIYTLTVSSTWTTTLSVNSLALASGVSGTVGVTVTIPIHALDGEIDAAVITATSQTEIKISDSAILTTAVGISPLPYHLFLPFNRN